MVHMERSVLITGSTLLMDSCTILLWMHSLLLLKLPSTRRPPELGVVINISQTRLSRSLSEMLLNAVSLPTASPNWCLRRLIVHSENLNSSNISPSRDSCIDYCAVCLIALALHVSEVFPLYRCIQANRYFGHKTLAVNSVRRSDQKFQTEF